MYALHTPATGGEERVIEPIKWMRSTTHQLQVERRARVIEPIKCMRSPPPATGGEEREHRANHVVCAHHTPATGGEERES